MGINSHLKIIVGIKLTKEQTDYIGYYDPDYPDDYEGKDLELAQKIYSSFDTVYDVMCGDYLYIGKELFESIDGRYDPWMFHEQFYIEELDKIRGELDVQLPLVLRPYMEWKELFASLHIFVHLT